MVHNFKKLIFQTRDGNDLLILRIGLAIVLMPHGAQKLLGWFGGYGFSATMNFLTETASLPWIIAFLVIFIESAGAILLLLGFLTRPISLLIAIQFIGIIFHSHLDNGFFINWMGNQSGEGFEYHLLIISMAVTLTVASAGSFSLDSKLYQKIKTGV